jgi:Ca2+-transporting ATPase
MQRKPRGSNESIFAGGVGFDMVVQGLIMAIIVIASFFIGQYMELGHFGIFDSKDGITMAFLTANFIEMFHAIAMRSQRESIFKLNTFNFWLLGAFLLTTFLTLIVIYVPFLAKIFEFTSINLAEFSVAFGLAFSIIPIIEIIKFFQRRIDRKAKV